MALLKKTPICTLILVMYNAVFAVTARDRRLNGYRKALSVIADRVAMHNLNRYPSMTLTPSVPIIIDIYLT